MQEICMQKFLLLKRFAIKTFFFSLKTNIKCIKMSSFTIYFLIDTFIWEVKRKNAEWVNVGCKQRWVRAHCWKSESQEGLISSQACTAMPGLPNYFGFLSHWGHPFPIFSCIFLKLSHNTSLPEINKFKVQSASCANTIWGQPLNIQQWFDVKQNSLIQIDYSD